MGSQGGVGPFGMQKASQYLDMFRMSDSQRLSPPDPARLSPSFMEGSLEVKLPKIWTNGKAEVGRVREDMIREQKRKHGNRNRKKKKQRRKKKEERTKNKEERTKNKEERK
jgi:hypothetical protein